MNLLVRSLMVLMRILPLSVRTFLPAETDQDQPQFKARVNLVSLDVEVLNGQGDPVPDLAREQFLVNEDGKPMQITNFAWLDDRPVSLALVLDTSAISAEKLVTFKRFIRELAYVLARTDELCLYSFDSRDVYLEMEFTSRRPALEDALDNIGVPRKGSGGFLKELFGQAPPTGLAIDRALRKLRAGSHGRKALLVASNRFRGLGPATVEHVQWSGCTLLTLTTGNSTSLLVTLGGDRISRNQLMKESGGRQFSADTEDITGTCRRIAFSLKNHYAIGYLTEIEEGEKKPRRIEVKIPGKDYTIHHRRTYAVK